MSRLILFSNPYLDQRFRAVVDRSEAEIGGFLMVRSEPQTWPGKFSYREFKAAFGLVYHPWFIEGLMIVPNESATPLCEWMAWDYEKAKDLAEQTGMALGSIPINFHTHPGETAEPSPMDLAFAAAECELYKGCAAFCVVTGRPLRIRYYELETHAAALPECGVKLRVGEFVSWRSPRLRRLVGG